MQILLEPREVTSTFSKVLPAPVVTMLLALIVGRFRCYG